MIERARKSYVKSSDLDDCHNHVLLARINQSIQSIQMHEYHTTIKLDSWQKHTKMKSLK